MNQTPYQIEFAKQYPLMQAKWGGKRDLDVLDHAEADIIATLQYHDAHDAYAGKLYAELDAIREAKCNRLSRYKREPLTSKGK